MAQVPAGIGRQRYCHIGQPNTAELVAVRIDRRDEMGISLALPWRQRRGDPVRRLPAEIEPRDPWRMRRAATVENKRLGASLAFIRERQSERAEVRSAKAPRRRDQRDARLFKIG